LPFVLPFVAGPSVDGLCESLVLLLLLLFTAVNCWGRASLGVGEAGFRSPISISLDIVVMMVDDASVTSLSLIAALELLWVFGRDGEYGQVQEPWSRRPDSMSRVVVDAMTTMFPGWSAESKVHRFIGGCLGPARVMYVD